MEAVVHIRIDLIVEMPPSFEVLDRDDADVFAHDHTTILLAPDVSSSYVDEDGNEWFVGSRARLTAQLARSAEGLADRLTHWWHRLTIEDREWIEENPQKGKLLKTIPPGLAEWLWKPEAEVVSFLVTAGAELRAEALRWAELLRWRHMLGGPDLQAIRNASVDWSLDEREWCRLPGARFIDADVPDVEGDPWCPGETDVTQAALEDPTQHAPLAHEILMEAVTILPSNPRAALVLAITAAEVGIHHYARQASGENAAWLLAQPQSPPIDILMKNYLPFTTHVRTRKGRVIPNPLRAILKKANSQRNDVVHAGLPAPPREELESIVVSVRDLLYLLDWLGGDEWALQHVASQWRQEYD